MLKDSCQASKIGTWYNLWYKFFLEPHNITLNMFQNSVLILGIQYLMFLEGCSGVLNLFKGLYLKPFLIGRHYFGGFYLELTKVLLDGQTENLYELKLLTVNLQGDR